LWMSETRLIPLTCYAAAGGSRRLTYLVILKVLGWMRLIMVPRCETPWKLAGQRFSAVPRDMRTYTRAARPGQGDCQQQHDPEGGAPDSSLAV
jgi:hypothetical protein